MPSEASGSKRRNWAGIERQRNSVHAAQVAQRLRVGMEIDYETNTSPNLPALQQFTSAYRAIEA